MRVGIFVGRGVGVNGFRKKLTGNIPELTVTYLPFATYPDDET